MPNSHSRSSSSRVLKLSIADAKAQFTRLLHEVEFDQQRFIMTKKDNGVAAMVSLEDLELLETLTDKWFLEHAIEKLDGISMAETQTLGQLEQELNNENE